MIVSSPCGSTPCLLSLPGENPDHSSCAVVDRAVHDRAKELFRVLDADRTARLSKEQLVTVLGAELAQRFVAKMDADRDGRISLTEWMGFFEHMCDKVP